MSRSSGTLVLALSYAFIAPTPNDFSSHSLLATLPFLSEASPLENKDDKRTVLLSARLSFQDHSRKKLDHMKDDHFCTVLPRTPRRVTLARLFLSENAGWFSKCTPFFSKVVLPRQAHKAFDISWLSIFDRKV